MLEAVMGSEPVVIIWFGVWPGIGMGSGGTWGVPTGRSEPAGGYGRYERTDEGDACMLT